MSESLELSTMLTAIPQRVYESWLNSADHSVFTGGIAQIDPRVGGAFTAWDGYIQGKTLELEPYTRILQSWRTSDFPEDAPDSLLEVLLEPHENETRLTLRHTNIPDGQGAEYQQGWEDYYFKPMQEYFG